MIIDRHPLTASDEYLSSRGLLSGDCCFFDIETTGFSASTSHLYLIGAAVYDESDGQWSIVQWLCEKLWEEADLLRAFAKFLEAYSTVVHFNGNRFDIPYLEQKYTQYQIPSPFTGRQSVDLYQEFRPLKSFLHLKEMNQKALEVYLGLHRSDVYDGGRLIPVYRDFLKTGSEEDKRLLLLHNREDVSGMFTLTGLYGFLHFLQPQMNERIGPVLPDEKGTEPQNKLESPREDFHCEGKLITQNEERFLQLTFALRPPVPRSFEAEYPWGKLSLSGDQGTFTVPFFNGTLRYFFPDYRNYYYLPQEDTAIHKSVAVYVDKAYREPAKAANCYVKQEGVFLPQPFEDFTPVYRKEYNDPLRYFLWKEEDPDNPSNLCAYCQVLLAAVRASCG